MEGRELPEVDGYETVRKVGEGGVGAVYLARSRGEPERLFALKFLHAHTAMREADLHRFLREGRLGQRLHHPHVLPVHAIHESRHGPVLVMDYVEGTTLAGFTGAEGLAERLVILASIADALEHLHRNGVAHRDVKPANVLVREDGHPFLIDFGFSRTLAVDSTITASGTLLGTPAYLAPELLRGSAGGDFRSDVYALGVTLFEVTSGSLPYAGDDLPALFERILFAEPPSLARLAPQAPRGLEIIVRRCLEKLPQDRYPSAAAVRDDLRRVAAGMAPRGGGASLWFKRELRRLRRERLRLTAGVAVLLLALVAALFLVLRGVRGRLEARELVDVRAAGLVQLDRGELEQALLTFDSLAERSPAVTAIARADAFAEFELWNRAGEEVERAHTLGYPADAAHPAEDLYHGAIVDFVARRYAEADAALVRALALEPELYRAHFLLFQLRFRQGRTDDARRALEECRRNLKEVNPRHAVVSSFLARLDGRFDESIALLTELGERMGESAPAWLRRRLGEAYLVAHLHGGRDPGHLQRATEELTRAIELEPSDGSSWSNLGNAQLLAGARSDARASGERALACDAHLPSAHRLLAALDAQQRDWASAERHLEQAEDASVAVLELPILRAEFAYQRGKDLYYAGKPSECIRELQRCLGLDPEHLAARCLLAQSATLVEDGRLGFDEATHALALLEHWKPRFATGLLPGEGDGLAFQNRNRPDVHISLVSSAGRIAGTLREDELVLVSTSLGWLRTGGVAEGLDDASAMNLALSIARAPRMLRDCEWAHQILETRNLWEKFEQSPAGAESLRSIEEACD